jgi:sporulation integral membrane protein YtvI
MPENIDYISRHINVFIQKYFQFYDDLTPNFKKKLDIILTNFNKDTSNLITSFAKHIINFSGNFVSRLPSILLFVFILSLSSFFFIKDYDLIMRFFTNNLPRKFLEKFILIKKSLLDIILKYLKAVLILMLLAICEITVALWILRVDYALTIGVLAGLVDVLPILGTAVVLLPIALTNLINGNYYIASSILIVQIVCFTVKQILEPKIISNQIGVHPLVAIISIYVGAELFGAKGVILGPVISFLTINSISTYYKNINLNQIT